jgi:hypothetical protein
MIEYSKLKRIHREKFEEHATFTWPTKNEERVFGKNLRVKHKNSLLEEIPIKANKSKFDSKL